MNIDIIRHSKYIKTNEFWYPSFNEDGCQMYYKCSLSILKLKEKNTFNCIISACGLDDTRYTFSTLDISECIRVYRCITDFTTQEDLINMGFVYG